MSLCSGKLVGITSLATNTDLNGFRGRVVGAQGDRWVIDVFVLPARRVAVKAANLITVPDAWVQATSCSLFDQHGMMTHFKAPQLPCKAPTLDIFCSRQKPPNIDAVMAFWGPQVFKFMMEKLRYQLDTQSTPGTNWAFRKTPPRCGMVFSDGTKPTQCSGLVPGQWGMWWPVVFAPHAWIPGEWVCYCQQQALVGGRAWETHPDRIEPWPWATENTEFVEPPGPVIEEISEVFEIVDDDGFSDYEFEC